MPFVEVDGRLTWVADGNQPIRSQRGLIEKAAQLLADMTTEEEYICIDVPAETAGDPPVQVCFRLEGESWVFDKIA
ncbi:hypothetical protein GCM10023185_31570 [Hymenobacter saemangeumensis]|uniref:Uncharacterized protein n=1 Tax=Hymenobacter saemangeumensis TaxID=1084522 RepID=A0ABP8IM70_9BACT